MADLNPEAALSVVRHGLDDPDYLALLRDYLAWRLDLDIAAKGDAELIENLIEAAGRRFAQVSFLADRRKTGRVSDEDLRHLTGTAKARRMGRSDRVETEAAPVDSDPDFYRLWLLDLDREYGRKLAESVRLVLALLSAVEEAHNWVFRVGRKEDPATGGVLTPLTERFDGVEINLLARLLDLDRPHAAAHDRIDPGLLFTLQTLQGVLAISRGESGASRFKVALKDFLPTAQADAALGPMLPQMHARIATKALDAFETVEDGEDDAGPEWELFTALAPVVEACVALSRSGLLERRWQPPRLWNLVFRLDAEWDRQGHAAARVSLLTLAAAWIAPRPGEHLDRRKNFATVLLTRGNAWVSALDLAKAIGDYDAAIGLAEGLRDALAGQGLAWPPDCQIDLATTYMNRAIAKAQAVGPAAAIGDYDAAIGFMEGLCDALAAQGLAWPSNYQNALAGAYMNRAIAKGHAFGQAAAIADYDAAIGFRESLREALAAQGLAWPPDYQNELAKAYLNRAVTKSQTVGPAAAIGDCDAAIGLMEGLRNALAAQGLAWPLNYQSALAAGYLNRATAKVQAVGPAAAIGDCDVAIGLRESLRGALAAQGLAWPPDYQNELAIAYLNRATAKAQAVGPAAAIGSYDAAIGLMEGLRDALAAQGLAWPSNYQNDLAAAYVNRAVAKGNAFGPPAAIEDEDAAIRLRESLRDALAAQGLAWPPHYQNDLATAYLNRALTKAAIGPAAAIADYDAAIGLMEGLRHALAAQGLAWPPDYQKALGRAYGNRAFDRARARLTRSLMSIVKRFRWPTWRPK